MIPVTRTLAWLPEVVPASDFVPPCGGRASPPEAPKEKLNVAPAEPANATVVSSHRGTHSFSAFVHGKSPAFYFAATYSILRATSLSPDCSVRTTNVTISLYRSKHLPQRTRIHPALLRCREPRLFDVSPPPSRALTTDGPGLAPHNTGAIRGQ